MATTDRHKVFVSYHHDDEDEKFKKLFCELLGLDIVDKSVEDGDIHPLQPTDTTRQQIRDNFIADATVTVVLVGKCTWQRKHVDWEIGSSLRDTKKNSRCGLLGILLPSHYNYSNETYNSRLIPPRLADNCGKKDSFAKIYDWPKVWNTDRVRNWIHTAFQRRTSVFPDNSRLQFRNNRSGRCSDGWSN